MSNGPPLATCVAQEWTYNSKGESPCYVAVELAKVCSGGVFGLPALPQGQSYLGPEAGRAPSCRCNTVYYSLLSACAYCQDGSWTNWPFFKANCSTTYTEFPEPIPAGLVVPKWAFEQHYEDGGAWIADRAKAIPGETTGPPVSTKPSLNIGAIVGGAVGGVIFLVITALALFFLLRRRNRRREAERIDILGAVYPQDTGPGNMAHISGGIGSTPPPVSHLTGTTIVTTVTPPPRTSTSMSPQTMKLYNPDDPSTWPHNYSMYPSMPDTSIPTSLTTKSTTRFTSFSSSGISTAPLLPELTGVSTTTAVTQARTTVGDNRYRNIEF